MTRTERRALTGSSRWLAVPPLAALAALVLAGPAAGSAAAAAPLIPNLLVNGTVNQPVSGTLPGSVTGTVTFSLATPNLMPPGIAVTPAGRVTGIPTADGIYGVTVTACGTSGCTPGTITFMIAPDAAPCDNQPDMKPLPGPIGAAMVAAG